MGDINQFLKNLLKNKKISKPLPREKNITPHYRDYMESIEDLYDNCKVIIRKSHVDLIHDDGRAAHLDIETGQWEYKKKNSDNYRPVNCVALDMAAKDIRDTGLHFIASIFGAFTHIDKDHT